MIVRRRTLCPTAGSSNGAEVRGSRSESGCGRIRLSPWDSTATYSVSGNVDSIVNPMRSYRRTTGGESVNASTLTSASPRPRR